MKRGIKALSASCLLLAAALLSCGEAAAPANTPDTLSVNAETAAETEPAETRVQHQVPVGTLDFGGAEYRSDYPDWQGYSFYFFANEENGDTMNDALWHRTRAVEEALNVKFVNRKHDTIDTVVSDMKPMILAGEDCAEAIFLHCISGVSTFASEGYLYNLDLLPYIDMSAEWWNREQMDALRLGNNTYYAVNDFIIPCPYVVYFNKQLIQDFDLGDPYELAFSGKWTLDVFQQMAETVIADLDGDGKMTKADRYGVSGNDGSLYSSVMIGCGQFITGKDENGRMSLVMNTPKTQSLFERFAGMAKKNVFYMPTTGDLGIDGVNIDNNQVLFMLGAISSAEYYREYTVDFGFLPYPKYDEAQERYYSLDWGGLMGVPLTITNPEMVGAVMELLAWESANEVIPTYYGKVLTGKLARDENAVRVMDILFDTIAFEPGMNYFGFSGMNDLLFSLANIAIKKQSTDFASLYAKNEKSVGKALDKFYASLDDVETNN